MLARQAVLLTLPSDDGRPNWSYLHTGTLPRLISFVSHSYENGRGVYLKFPFWNSAPCARRPPSPIGQGEIPFGVWRLAAAFPPATHPQSISSSLNSAFSTAYALDLSLSFNIQLSTFSFQPSHFSKSFSSNTYRPPRKCCRQRTYTLVKPFRCNTYKKHGGGGS